MKKIFRYILLCLPLVLLMSHNTFAADINLNSLLIGSYNGTVQFCTDYVNDSTATKHSSCYSGQNKYWTTTGSNRLENLNKFNFAISGIKLTPAATIPAGRLVVAEFYLNNMAINDSQDTNMVGLRGYDNRIDVISTTFSNLDNNTAKFDVIFRVKESFSTSQSIYFASSAAPSSLVNDSSLMGYNFLWLRGQANAGIMGGHYSVYALQTGFDDTDIINAVNNLEQSMGGMADNIEELKQQHDDDVDAINNAVDDAQDAADTSTSDAENATTGLINVIGGFVSVITNASPSNCIINGKINNSFDMGNLDLCAMPAPPFVQIIGSLILISVCIPFCIIMFNRFIGLFRSFQG